MITIHNHFRQPKQQQKQSFKPSKIQETEERTTGVCNSEVTRHFIVHTNVDSLFLFVKSSGSYKSQANPDHDRKVASVRYIIAHARATPRIP